MLDWLVELMHSSDSDYICQAMFLSLDERIEQLEHELGLVKKRESTLSDKLKEEHNDPTTL